MYTVDAYYDRPSRRPFRPIRHSCTILLYKFVLQTGLGMGMGINGTAQ